VGVAAAEAAEIDESAVALPDVSAEFLRLRVVVDLARAEAAPEAATDVELTLRFVAIVRYFSP